MRILSTFFFLFIISWGSAQSPDTGRVCTRCWDIKIPDTVVVINCWGKNKQTPKQDTVPNQFVCKTGGVTVIPAKKDTVATKGIRIHCLRTLTDDDEPLFVINGKPLVGKQTSKLVADDIEKIEILKGPVAMAIYGSAGANGVVLITLKLKYKQFIVIDSIDNSPVARATAGITMKNGDNSMWYVADDKGAFASNSPDAFNDLTMTVSAVGYEPATRIFNGDIAQTDTIRLRRNIKTFDPVIVSATQCWKKIVCYGYVRMIKTRTEKAIAEKPSSFSIYPNPAGAGTPVFIRFNDPTGISTMRVGSLDGKTLLQQPVSKVQKSIFRLDTDPRWPAGVYFVQLVYENGRIVASGKIIIQ